MSSDPVYRLMPITDAAAFDGVLPILAQFMDTPQTFLANKPFIIARFTTACGQGYRFFAALDADGRMVGAAGLRLLTDPMDPAPVGEINNLITDYSFRERGIGTFLLRALENIARTEGALGIRVLVDPTIQNLAAYYRKRGYQMTGTVMLRVFGEGS